MAESIEKLMRLIKQWESETVYPIIDPSLVLTRIAEIFEAELNSYYVNNDTNPFEYRHVLRFSQNCDLAKLYGIVFQNIILVHSLIVKYLNEHYMDRPKDMNWGLNVATCRLLLNLIPSVEIYTFLQTFEKETIIIRRLFNWAENSKEPLQTYATGLLSFLGFSTISFKQAHRRLVPIVLDRLCSLYTQFCEETNQIDNSSTSIRSIKTIKIRRTSSTLENISGDSAENIESQSIRIYPLPISTQLYYCLKYLVPTAMDAKFLCYAYSKNAIEMIFKIIKSFKNLNGYITFEAVKYLGNLLSHKQFAVDFIATTGLQDLLVIPKESIPSHGIPVCLFYLSSYEQVMETISQLPNQVLSDIVQYAILLLKSPYNSSRCHTVQFLNCSFNYRTMHELFDEHEGIYNFIDVINKTLSLLISDEQIDLPLPKTIADNLKRTIHHVTNGLQIYFMGHLLIKTQQIRETKMIELSEPTSFFGGYQSLNKITLDKFFEEIDLLSTDETVRRYWMPVDNFTQVSGLNMLLKLINKAIWWLNDENNYMNTVITNVSMVINICAVSRKGQLQLCEPLCRPDEYIHGEFDRGLEYDDELDGDGLTVLTNLADGHKALDPVIQLISLSTIVICVCAPIHTEEETTETYGSSEDQSNDTDDEDTVKKFWYHFRRNNGIYIITALMSAETPTNYADTIRKLACRGLTGLVRCEHTRQIISKLPLFANGKLQYLMKKPVARKNLQEHMEFQQWALQLIELVTGKSQISGEKVETSLSILNQIDIVAKTKIDFDEKQLLFLVHKYCQDKGLINTAALLTQEATNLNIIEKNEQFSLVDQSSRESDSLNFGHAVQYQTSELAGLSKGAVNSGSGTLSPKRLTINRLSDICPEPESQCVPLTFKSTVSLQSIVTEFLAKQHAACTYPIITCPQFDLFVCPCPKKSTKTNFAMRFSNNERSRRLDQRLIHSHFCSTNIFRYTNIDYAHFTCCEFINHDLLAAGRSNGQVQMFNLISNKEIGTFSAHEYSVDNLECSNDGKLLLSLSCHFNDFTITLWDISNRHFTSRFSLNNEKFGSFSNKYQDKILATNGSKASIYDIETNTKLLELVPSFLNEYKQNRAVFNPTNELVLSDSVLWDVSSQKEIYKFDKLNHFTRNDVFHPNGTEIISCTEVWDARTFKLLRRVPCFNKSNVLFSKSGDGMYVCTTQDLLMNTIEDIRQTTFKTLDPFDYSNITTYDTGSYVYDFAINNYDTKIAVVEGPGIVEHCAGFYVQIYDVGRAKMDEEVVADLVPKENVPFNNFLSRDWNYGSSSDSSSSYSDDPY